MDGEIPPGLDMFETLGKAGGGAGALLTGPGGFARDAAQMRAAHAARGAALEAAGIPRGAVVAAMLPDTPDAAETALSLCHHLRLVPLNPALGADDLAHQLAASGARLLLHDTPLPALPGDVAALRIDCASGRIAGRAPGELPPGAPGLVLFTSGSTGLPRPVPLDLGRLYLSARNIARWLALGPGDCAVHALPMFHIGGFVDLLLAPLLAGGRVRFAGGRDPAALAGAVQAGGTWLQIVPTMLAAMEAQYTADDWAALGARLRFVRSVSSDLAPARQARAEALLGGVPVIAMWGMSETAGQITSNPLPPGARKPGSVGVVAGEGLVLEVTDAAGHALPPGETGELRLRGPTVMARGGAGAAFDEEGRLCTGDLGRIDGEGYVFLAGRAKEMINRGGEKISPLEVEAAALALDGVLDAACFARPHATLGEQVGLAVVLAEGGPGVAALEAHLAGRLAAHKLPRRIEAMAALPRLPGGKVDRRALAAAEGAEAEGPGAEVEGMAALVARAWASVLGAPPSGPQADFFDAGGDSLSATQMIFEVERLSGRHLEAGALFDAPRFADFAAHVEAAPPRAASGIEDEGLAFVAARVAEWPDAPVPGWPWAVRLPARAARAAPAGAPFFWFCQHPREYRALGTALSEARDVIVMRTLFQKVGKDEAQARALARHYADTVEALAPGDGLLRLGGFCEGGRIARYVAEALAARGRGTALLVLWDHWPSEPVPVPSFHVWSTCPIRSVGALMVAPEAALHAWHPEGADHVILPGIHEQTLARAPDPALVARLQRLIDGQEVLPRRAVPEGVAPPHGPQRHLYRAAFTLAAPRLAAPGGAFEARVAVTNRSPHEWRPTVESGLHVVLRTRNLDNCLRSNLAGHAPLARPVAPGETVHLRVPARYPQVRLPVWLCAGMIDNGVARFGERSGRGGRAVRRMMWPLLP